MSEEATSVAPAEGGGGFGLKDLKALVRRHLRLILVAWFCLSGISVSILVLIPNRYEATATVQIDPRKRTVAPIENVTSDLRIETPIIESEVEVVRSRPVIARVIEQLNLRHDKEYAEPGFKAWILGKLGLNTWAMQMKQPPAKPVAPTDEIARLLENGSSQRFDPEQDEVATAIASALKVARVRNSLVIEIRFVAKDPIKAARIANAIADAYITEQVESKVRATTQAVDALEQKLDGLRRQVYDNERRVAQFKSDNGMSDSEGALLIDKQLARMMEESVRAGNARAEALAKYQQIMQLKESGQDKSGVGEVLASHTVRMLKEQHSKVTRERAEMLTRYGARHPAMQKINAEARDVQLKLDAEVEQIVGNLRSEYEVAANRERQLTATLEGLKMQQVVMRDAAVRLREMEREAQSSRQVFEAFLARYKQTVETQSLQLADARVVESADVPLYPSSPKRKMLLIAAVVGALVFGLGLAFLVEMTTPGLRRPEDVEREFHAALVAKIPLLDDDIIREPMTAMRMAVTDHGSLFAEAIRSARHEIDAGWSPEKPRIILIGSTLANEGKSLLASNLAHQYAVSGVRVLLIDADLRRASLSEKLGLDNRPGLHDALEDGRDLNQVILRDTATGLHIMPAAGPGAHTLTAPEALASAAFATALATLKQRYDVILIDAPPLLPVVDARIVADHADQIVMTMTWRTTPIPLAKRAMRLLGANVEKVVGVMVNRVDISELDDSIVYSRETALRNSAARQVRVA